MLSKKEIHLMYKFCEELEVKGHLCDMKWHPVFNSYNEWIGDNKGSFGDEEYILALLFFVAANGEL